MTIPAIRKLRAIFPQAEFTLQTREWARGIFQDSGLFDHIVTPSSLSDEIKTLRKSAFDIAVIFPNSFESALSARLSGSKRRFGYAADRRSFLLTDAIPIPAWKDTRHEVHYYLELIAAVERAYRGVATVAEDLEPRLTITAAQKERARHILEEHGVGERVIALAPGSTNSRAKRWLPENFAKLTDRLSSELSTSVIMLGSNDDREVSSIVAGLSRNKPVDLTGVTSIADAAGILSVVDLLVTNDMGLAHVAPAVGTKTLVIFGPTNPVTTRPFSEHAAIVSANVECSPCMLRDCPIDHRCMTRVSADEVFEKVVELLH